MGASEPVAAQRPSQPRSDHPNQRCRGAAHGARCKPGRARATLAASCGVVAGLRAFLCANARASNLRARTSRRRSTLDARERRRSSCSSRAVRPNELDRRLRVASRLRWLDRDRRGPTFATTSQSPLTDSNRRPPPYHGGFGASRAYTGDHARHTYSSNSHGSDRRRCVARRRACRFLMCPSCVRGGAV